MNVKQKSGQIKFKHARYTSQAHLQINCTLFRLLWKSTQTTHQHLRPGGSILVFLEDTNAGRCFPDSCNIYFDAITFVWQFNTAPCGSQMFLWMGLNYEIVVFVFVIALDIAIFIKLRHLKKQNVSWYYYSVDNKPILNEHDHFGIFECFIKEALPYNSIKISMLYAI